ncbi:DUF1758 domain-containing protein [Nephila pilipes]|uniref:DUF1758 domain-containing protein n=1 Tax=Nephila pilipes TaxID=299642 RepID=A0A8X6NRV7_NEPPI|nr:DUF1758 domain-containing protein [Nephila pilipes]
MCRIQTGPAGQKINPTYTAPKPVCQQALLDSGSESSFVSEKVINILGLKRKNDRLSLSGISGVPVSSVVLKIGSRFKIELITVNAYILNKVTSQIPIVNTDIKELDCLKGVPLSDEDFSRPLECDIILGSDCFFTILRNGKIIGSEGQPIAQSTMSSWAVVESTYACVIYDVQRNDNGITKVTILAAKSKVTPLKPVSIPRLTESPSCPFPVVFNSSYLEAVHRQQDFRDLGLHPSELMAVRTDQRESL